MSALFRSTVAIGLLAVLAACTRPEVAPEPVRSVRTMTVAREDAVATQEYAAEIRARTESKLGFQVGGRLVARQVDVGERVRAGQVLARIDPQDLRLGVDAARAALEAAQVELTQAAADFSRFRSLREQGFISAAELERHESRLKAAQAQAAQARAQVGVQGNLASYAELRAVAPGVVTAVEAEPGAVLSAGAPVLRVAHDGPRDVVFAVPEHQVDFIRALGLAAPALQVRLWGNAQATHPARIREVAAAADPVTRTFLVKADVGAVPVQLGQTATVVAELPRVTGAIRLPLSALLQQQGRTVVWVFDPQTSTVDARPVEVAGAVGNDVLLASGLEPGTVVVTAGVHVLTPGQKVSLYRGATLAATTR
jgi:RND family efflux transporter MFP subunit